MFLFIHLGLRNRNIDKNEGMFIFVDLNMNFKNPTEVGLCFCGCVKGRF